ncbi:hypothetical protein KC19_9G105100 [Ceratodon purpureus]|uniref:Uncharacterized protein n=1 Tax=Ceratodon purpureus TaxID=3225 RepID=A0A8T0GU83_CERPU|nr:hypothetical protein KC19_9G105100 [Ceratodon purpureus]
MCRNFTTIATFVLTDLVHLLQTLRRGLNFPPEGSSTMATLQKPGKEITPTEKAEIGAETAKLEGKGPAGQATEAVKNVVTGRDDGPSAAVVDRGRSNNGFGAHHHHDNGTLGHTEEEFARLRTRTQVTHEGEAYCPNPNIKHLPREFETRVTVIQRYPEMRTVEKTDFVKEIHHEERTIIVPKTRVIMDEIEHVDRVPVVRQVPKTRIEIYHRVVTEEREVTDMVPIIEYMDVPRIEQVPRVITEDVEERITVPVVREVPVTRMVEVPTGNYCEAPAGEFINPGHFNLLGHKHRRHKSKTHSGGLLSKLKSSSSSSSSDDEKTASNSLEPHVHHHADGTTTVDQVSPSASKRKSLLQRIIHH